MSEKKVRAAIYARVSTTEQNPELQLEDLREYVERRGFVLYKEYVDYVTGSFEKRKKKRKAKDTAYEELMADARKRLIDCVIVWKYDRFARSLKVLIEALDEFNKLGVDFISHQENVDTTTPMGRLFYNVIGSFSEFEREIIVERVRAGLANARAKGIKLGRPEKDASAPQRIAALREEGWSLRQIAERENLSPAGVLKILRRGKEPQAPLAEALEQKAQAAESIKKEDQPISQTKSRKWRIGAIFSFGLPFLIAGSLAEYYSWLDGAEDIARWSHLVEPKPVPMSEQVLPILLWFLLPGLVAGLVGLLLYYLFTRCRSY